MEEVYNLASNLDGEVLKIAMNGDINAFSGNNSEELANVLNANPNVKDIELELNSNGGSMFQGISMFNQLENHSANITTIVTGVAASAMSLVFMAGNKRIVRRGGFVMIHKPMAIGINNAKEMRDKAVQLDKFQTAIVDIYEAKVSIDRNEINNLVNNETWLNADEALEKGFSTESTELESEVSNKIDYGEFVNSYSSEIPKDAKKYFKNQSKYKIQQVLNNLKNTILNINPDKEDDMNKEEVQALLAEEVGKCNAEYSNKLDEVKTDFTSKLTEKDDVINSLNEKMAVQNSKILDLEAKGTLSSIENVVDGFINEGRITPANRDFEIENLKLREGKDSFETYKNSISSREAVVDMSYNVAHNGVGRKTTDNLQDEITNMLTENNLTMETANSAELKAASAKARQKIAGGK